MFENIPTADEFNLYFNSDTKDVDLESKVAKFKEFLSTEPVFYDSDLTNEQTEIKKNLSYKQVAIKNLNAFNKWIAFQDVSNQLESLFAYVAEIDEDGNPYTGKVVQVNAIVPKRIKGKLATYIDPVSGKTTFHSGDISRMVTKINIPAMQNLAKPYSVNWMVNNQVPYESLNATVGCSDNNPTKDYQVKQQIRKSNTSVKILEWVDVKLSDFIEEVRNEEGLVIQPFQPAVIERIRVEHKKNVLQVAKEEYARLQMKMQEVASQWQSTSFEAMTLEAMLQQASQKLNPEQLAQLLKQFAATTGEQIKNNVG